MKKYLLPQSGNFYKANMHMHTTYSDGQLTPQEVKELYMKNGYSIVAFTDHELLMPHNYLADENFLPITSVELATNEDDHYPFQYTKTYHLNLYAKDKNASSYCVRDNLRIWPGKVRDFETEEQKQVNYRRVYSVESMNDLIAKANAQGFLVSYNHPVWSLQSYNDYADLEGVWGIELYNTSAALGGYVDNEQPWIDLLWQGKNVFPLAADDAHKIQDTCGGWIMVKSEKLEYDTVMQALEKGDFYASNGPKILSLYIEDNTVHIRTSGAKQISLIPKSRKVRSVIADVQPITGAAFTLQPTDEYFRIKVVDENGKKAYTQAYRV